MYVQFFCLFWNFKLVVAIALAIVNVSVWFSIRILVCIWFLCNSVKIRETTSFSVQWIAYTTQRKFLTIKIHKTLSQSCIWSVLQLHWHSLAVMPEWSFQYENGTANSVRWKIKGKHTDRPGAGICIVLSSFIVCEDSIQPRLPGRVRTATAGGTLAITRGHTFCFHHLHKLNYIPFMFYSVDISTCVCVCELCTQMTATMATTMTTRTSGMHVNYNNRGEKNKYSIQVSFQIKTLIISGLIVWIGLAERERECVRQ